MAAAIPQVPGPPTLGAQYLAAARELAKVNHYAEIYFNAARHVVSFVRHSLSCTVADLPPSTIYDISNSSCFSIMYVFGSPRDSPRKNRVDVYYATGTVGTCLIQPYQGKTPLFRRNCSIDELASIFSYPRVHLGKFYQQRSIELSIATALRPKSAVSSGKVSVDPAIDEEQALADHVAALQRELRVAEDWLFEIRTAKAEVAHRSQQQAQAAAREIQAKAVAEVALAVNRAQAEEKAIVVAIEEERRRYVHLAGFLPNYFII